MKFRTNRFAIAVIAAGAAIGAIALPALSQEGMEDMQAMMEKMGAPGEAHERLKALVGEWDVAMSISPAPGMEPLHTTGKVTKTMVLGGRFLHENLELADPMRDVQSHGVGYLGFDNVTGKYSGVWMSDSQTAMILYTGDANADGKSFTFTGEENDPTGMMGAIPFKMNLTIQSEDQHTLSFFYVINGQDVPTFEMVHTRRN